MYLWSSFWSNCQVLPNQRLSGSIRPILGSVGAILIASKSGLSLYIFSLLIVALDLKNPFPLSLSGQLGFVDAFDFLNAEFFVDLFAVFPI